MGIDDLTNASVYKLFENVLPYLQAAHREVRDGRRFDAAKVGAFLRLAEELLTKELGPRNRRNPAEQSGISSEGARQMLENMIESALAVQQEIFVPKRLATAGGDPRRAAICLQIDLHSLLDTATFAPVSALEGAT